MARGRESQHVVFDDDTPLTAPLAPLATNGSANVSLWGGLVVLGTAPVNLADAAGEDARRTLENRAAVASHIDWDELDVGAPPEEVRNVLAGADRIRRFNVVVRVAGTVVGLLMLALALVAVIATGIT